MVARLKLKEIDGRAGRLGVDLGWLDFRWA